RLTGGTSVPPLKPLSYKVLHGNRALCWLAFHHLLDVLCDDVGFQVDGIAGLERSEIGQLDRMGNDRDGAAVAFEFCDREADAFNADRSLVHGVLLDLGWNFNMQPPVLGILPFRVDNALELDQLSHAIHVSLNDVAVEAPVRL